MWSTVEEENGDVVDLVDKFDCGEISCDIGDQSGALLVYDEGGFMVLSLGLVAMLGERLVGGWVRIGLVIPVFSGPGQLGGWRG